MMTDKMVPLSDAEEVLKIKLRDLLLTPGIEIHTKKLHGETYVNPNEMMKANDIIKHQKEQHGK